MRERPTLKKMLPVALVAILGAALSLTASFYVGTYERQHAERDMELASDRHLEVLAIEIRASLEVLQSLGDFYRHSKVVTRDEFRGFTTRALARNPAIQAMEWIPRIAASDRERVEGAARRDGYPGFRITERMSQGEMAPAGSRPEFYPVFFVEPFRGNEVALGFDLASEPQRKAALEKARDTGELTATKRITLVQGMDGQYGVLLMTPVYRDGLPPAIVSQRRENLVGFVLAVFDIENLVNRALATVQKQVPGGRFDFHIFDLSAPTGEQLLYPRRAVAKGLETLRAGVRAESVVRIGDRDWLLMATPDSDVPPLHADWHPWAVLVFGLVMTGLLSGHVNVLARRGEERVAAAEALRESEERVRLLLDSAGEGIFGLDRNGKCFICNPASVRLLGYETEHDLVGKDMHALMHHTRPDGSPYPKGDCPVLGSINGRPGVRVDDEVFWRKDGTSFPVEYASFPLRRNGETLGVVVSFSDITRRNATEAALRRSEAGLRNAQRIACVGSWEWDMVAGKVHWSDEMFRIFGLDPDTFEPSHDGFIERVHPDERDRLRQDMEDAIRRHGRFASEFRIVRPDGNIRVIEALGEVAYDESGRPIGVSGVDRDVTESRALESQLRQAQKMEAVGQLTGGVAHDFNNLLTVILGNAEMLEDRVAGDERVSRFAKAIKGAALRGADLTNRLLVFSRRQALETKVVDLNAVVAAMAPLLRRTLGETIEIRTAVAADLWTVETDPSQLENALINLAVNARDAMAQGGRLTIETANVTLDEGYSARHADVSPGDYAMVEVSDTGTGMSKEVQARAFEPFFTTKERGKGTGLGLSMVYALLKQSRGHANIYSEVGQGTTVKLYFPRARATADPGAAVSLQTDPPVGRETVLVVEDNPEVRETAIAMLTELGYAVLEAGDGRAALAVLDAHPEVGLVFTDVIMPGGMNGIELGREARARRPDVRLLYASGYAEEHLVGGENAAEVRLNLIRKPYNRHDLAHAMRRVLDA